MLDSFPVALAVGIVLGFLSGLGIGGGSLLILWLTMVLGLAQQTARGINLLFFLPAAAISCLFRWRQGAVDFKAILPAAIAGCIAAAACTYLGTMLDLELLKKLFGILLIGTGLRELFYRPQKRNKKS